MDKRFIIYFCNQSEIEKLYSLPFVHYWNIRYDSAEELFSDCNGLIFDSKDHFTDWEIDQEAFLDFLMSISSRIIHDCMIAYDQSDSIIKGYLKLPENNIKEYQTDYQIIDSLEDFLRVFQIELTQREQNSIEYLKGNL